jgi:3-oxoacyl-[acyl-carrier protein] reductase/pteridine reductase
VNNAGRFTSIDPLKVTESDWDFVFDVNLKAVFFCCQEAARQMNEQGAGRIVNISSLGGMIPWAEHVPYCASKAGVIMLTRALAKAFAPRITVNSVAPGVIMFSEEGPPSKGVLDATPMHRTGKAEEVAEAVRFFLTAPDFITAQILAVDGGLSQR